MKRIIALFVGSMFAFGCVGCNNAAPPANEHKDTTSVTSNAPAQSQTIEPTDQAESAIVSFPTEPAESESTPTPSPGEPAKPESSASPLPTEPAESASETTPSPSEPIEPESTPVPLPPESAAPEIATTPPSPESTEYPEGDTNSSTEAPEYPLILSTMELKKVGCLEYYLYTPNNPTSNMPLIVYLHGGTNKKADVTALLTTEGFPKYLYDGYYGDLRAYVAIPKLDNSYKGWADVSNQIRDLIKSLHTDYTIDMKKIALTGHSMGGTGTYQLQIKLPNTFACIAPMSGSVQNTKTNLVALSKTKIWAFVGTVDAIVNPDSSRVIIKALSAQGANAKITELEGATHFDVPSLVYKDDALIQWLVTCGE